MMKIKKNKDEDRKLELELKKKQTQKLDKHSSYIKEKKIQMKKKKDWQGNTWKYKGKKN